MLAELQSLDAGTPSKPYAISVDNSAKSRIAATIKAAEGIDSGLKRAMYARGDNPGLSEDEIIKIRTDNIEFAKNSLAGLQSGSKRLSDIIESNPDDANAYHKLREILDTFAEKVDIKL